MAKFITKETAPDKYKFQCEPFTSEYTSQIATNPLIHASSAREAGVEFFNSADDDDAYDRSKRAKVIYECCQTIQSCANLLASMGTSSEEIAIYMDMVYRNNDRLGKYRDDLPEVKLATEIN